MDAAAKNRKTHWHARPIEGVLIQLGTSKTGLSEEEAQRLLKIHGPNRLKSPKRRGVILRLLAQFNNVLLYVLLGAALVTGLLSHWVDTGVIVGVVLINAIIGFIQEGKSEQALEALQAMLTPQASVRRGGKLHTLPADHLVPGDIVVLQSGDKVPADMRLIDTNSLEIQEAVLTGESEAVAKAPEPVA